MQPQRSEPANTTDLLAAVEESARRGDWKIADALAAKLARFPVPTAAAELGLYLDCLQKALITARASRAHSIASLRKVNAAASFSHTRLAAACDRQNFVDSPEL